MAQAHLHAGHDVLLPQYLGRLEFMEMLREVAVEVGATFVEVALLSDRDDVVRRFERRLETWSDPGHREAAVLQRPKRWNASSRPPPTTRCWRWSPQDRPPELLLLRSPPCGIVAHGQTPARAAISTARPTSRGMRCSGTGSGAKGAPINKRSV